MSSISTCTFISCTAQHHKHTPHAPSHLLSSQKLSNAVYDMVEMHCCAVTMRGPVSALHNCTNSSKAHGASIHGDSVTPFDSRLPVTAHDGVYVHTLGYKMNVLMLRTLVHVKVREFNQIPAECQHCCEAGVRELRTHLRTYHFLVPEPAKKASLQPEKFNRFKCPTYVRTYILLRFMLC